MFTGIIEKVGTIVRVERLRGNRKFWVEESTLAKELQPGESISLNGVCLTIEGIEGNRFWVEATSHTLSVTNLHLLSSGCRVNLERALRWGDRVGGHFVQGHVDGIGRVVKTRFREGSVEVTVEATGEWMEGLVRGGSVAIDGVSLTVVEKSPRWFKVILIPYTIDYTTLGDLKPGQMVNVEIDLFAKMIGERLKQYLSWWSEEHPSLFGEERGKTFYFDDLYSED